MLEVTHWPYIYTLLVVTCLAFIGLVVKYNKSHNLVVGFFILILTSALTLSKAVGVGADDLVYQSYFDSTLEFPSNAEPLFGLLIWIFSNLGLGVEAFALLTNFVVVAGGIVLCVYFKVPIAFWIAFYMALGAFFEITYDHIRNGLALGVTLLVLPYLFEKKVKNYTIGVIAAVLIHYSSVIFLVLPLWLKLNLSRKSKVTILLLTIVVTNLEIYARIFDLINSLGGFGIDALVARVQSKDLYSEFAAGFSWTLFGLLKYLIAFSGIYFFGNRGPLSKVVSVYIYGIVLWATFHEIGIFSGRFWRSLSVVEPLIVFHIVYLSKKRIIAAIAMVIFLLYAGNRFIIVRSQPFEFALSQFVSTGTLGFWEIRLAPSVFRTAQARLAYTSHS